MATTMRRCTAKLDELDELMGDLGHPGAVVRATDAAFQADIAAVREAGLNIMMSMKGDGKPVSFIEDCAVDLEDLADYTERLNEVFERHGTKGTWYAHASVGCLHVRPVLNMKDPQDVATMRAVAEECFALVREYKGSHSGEHGDGLVRSEFHETMFGPRIVRAFETVKDAFDPHNMLNPGRIVRPPRMDDRTLFRYAPGYAPIADFAPKLDWSDHPGPLGGMLGAVEMCNNNGTCRAFDAGVMCPSYRVTRDETHLTRGRANTLRLALTGQLGADAMASDAVADAMSLCVSCKACKRECPTGVDMAKMKIEVLAARFDRHGLTRRDWLVAELPRYAPLVAPFAPLANLRNRIPPLRRLGERFTGFAAARPLPAWRRDAFRDREAEAFGTGERARRRDPACRHIQSLVRTGKSARRTARAHRRRISRADAEGSRSAALLRPQLSVRGHGGQGARGGASHARPPCRRSPGDRPGTVLPADPARRIPLAAAGCGDRGVGQPRLPVQRVPGTRKARSATEAAASHFAGARSLPSKVVWRLSRPCLPC